MKGCMKKANWGGKPEKIPEQKNTKSCEPMSKKKEDRKKRKGCCLDRHVTWGTGHTNEENGGDSSPEQKRTIKQ